MERIISDECLKSIMLACYAAGMHRRDLCTVRGPDGPEVVRCRDCKHCDKDAWECNRICIGYWDETEESDVNVRYEVDQAFYCAWGERA